MADGSNDQPGDKRAGRRVGLGRVVEDHLSTGSPDAGDPKVPDPAVDSAAKRAAADDETDDSFPASDPPGYMSRTPTPDGRRED